MPSMKSSLILNAREPGMADLALSKAAAIIRDGGVVAFPTESFYGLAADPANERALGRLFEAKKRPANNPILLLIDDKARVFDYAAQVPEKSLVLMRKIWPGRLSLVFAARPEVSSFITGGTGKIGLRVSSNLLACALARLVGGAITGTSANISQHRPCLTAEEVFKEIAARVDAILDGGPCPGGQGTTVLDISQDPPRILREGMVSKGEIERIIGEIT